MKVHFDDVLAQFEPRQLDGFFGPGPKEAGRLALTHRRDARERAAKAKHEFEEAEVAKLKLIPEEELKRKLMDAIENKDTELSHRLLKVINPNFKRTKYPQTPLHLAAGKEGNVTIVGQLLEADAKINQTDGCWETALHEAASYGHLEAVRQLVNSGAEVNHASTVGTTPLIAAAYRGHTEVVQLLVDRGARVNCANTIGNTPLHYATGHLQTADFLSRAGANKNALNHDRLTPAQEALKEGNLDVANLLSQ